MSDVYSLPEHLKGAFDLVIAAYGTINWLPDLDRWARVAAHFVRPAGTFYVVEFHPFSMIFDDEPQVTDLHVRFPYFGRPEPIQREGDYIGHDEELEYATTYEWRHPISEVICAIIDAGFRIEFFHEYPETSWKILPFMEHIGEGVYRLSEGHGSVPFVYSVKASKTS